MAARISHKSRCNSASFWRFTTKRADGTAAPIRMSKIVVATISSSKVTPRCDRCCFNAFISDAILIYRDRRLRSQRLNRLVLAVASARDGNRHHARPFRFGNEHQVEYRAVAGDATDARRTLRHNLQRTCGGIIPVYERGLLAVFRQEAPIRDVHELQHIRIIGNLQRYRVNVMRIREHYLYSKAASLRGRHLLRTQLETHGFIVAARRRWLGFRTIFGRRVRYRLRLLLVGLELKRA